MKRLRGEEGAQVVEGSLSPSIPRTLAAVQPSYVPQTVKASVPELNLVQQFPVQTFAPSSMPTVASTIKLHGGSTTPPSVGGSAASTQQQQQFQRLKVEDALSYLDNVKMKFNNHPQVYNDFLDIMKEFKSQSIDTPGVIERVSKLFQGHPDLILGFNTFLPPGYKIEVQTNDSGFQVQVSMPSPSTSTTVAQSIPSIHQAVIPGSALALCASSGTPTTVVVSTSTKPLIFGNTNILQQGQVAQPPVVATSVPAPTITPAAAAATTPQPTVSTVTHYNHLNPDCTPVQAIVNQMEPAQLQIGATAQVTGQPAPQNQPVEFNHAINYVNKIKNRFQDQPEIYKKFLEILNTYQKDQKNFKEAGKQLTEAEVYSQVAKLFQNQDDLLAEFGQFLPDATSHQATIGNKCTEHIPVPRNKPSSGLKSSFSSNNSIPSPSAVNSGPKFAACSTHPHSGTSSTPGQGSASNQAMACRPIVLDRKEHRSFEKAAAVGLKRSPSSFASSVNLHSHAHHAPAKKHKLSTSFRDVTIADAGKYGSLTEYAFFDKVHKSLRNQEVYDNFLRCIVLYNQEIVSRSELLLLVSPFMFRYPELFKWLKDFVGGCEGSTTPLSGAATPPQQGVAANHSFGEGHSMITSVASRQERSTGGELGMDIDYTTCKRLGASYCALPKSYVQPRCSGRTNLCKEVLNDTWVSFATWSEDSTFVTSRKTQYEEYIYRCEDERFELDVVIESNAATIRVLEGVHKKLCRLSSEEVAKFRLDECLGGNSPTIHQRALRRIYGDKAPDIIDGLKKNPVVAVPVVLRRLKAKEEEWREGQKGFNKVWKDQNEKFYLKSLDHQGINFKQNDLKALRSKSLFNEIETLFDEKHEQADETDGIPQPDPHIVLQYKDKSVLDDAANLLIHHVKRQTGIHKEDKQRIKQLLRQFVPDLFHHPRQELSEDEREELDDKLDIEPMSPDKDVNNGQLNNASGSKGKSKDDNGRDVPIDDIKVPIHAITPYADECYTLFFGNNKWYLFLRLHQILCERLTRIYERATLMALDENEYRGKRRESTSVALRLKPRKQIEIDDYYPAFLDMVKSVLDGNMDSTSYEDTLREMFGIHAYIAFTLDKVVSYAVRQLQHLVSDDACSECVDLFVREKRRNGAGGPCITAYSRMATEAAYQRKAEASLTEDSLFKMFIYKRDCKLSIELLDTDNDVDPDPSREAEKWSAYVDRYTDPHNKEKNLGLDGDCDGDGDGDGDDEQEPWGKAVFLPRNVRMGREKEAENIEAMDASPSPDPHKSNDMKMDSYDDSECRFNVNSYRMVFVVDRENYLYKKSALHKAKRSHPGLSKRLGARFRLWHENWKRENISLAQCQEASDWLMGRAPDTKANNTRILTDNLVEKPPYRPYNRYTVKLEAE